MPSAGGIRAGRAYVELGTNDSRLIKGLRSAQAKLKAFGDKVSKIGSSLRSTGTSILGFGTAAALPIGLAVKNFADFDDQMRTVKAVTQSSEAEFQKLTNTAKELGRTTSFTAVEVAGLMTELGRAGFTSAEIDTMTASVLNLSRATGTEAAQTAGIMAATLRQYNLDASQAARVSDTLTAAANKSFNTLESLGEAFSYAGPVAADLGMSVEETAAILGTLGNVGIQGSNAGTALRRLSTIGAAEAEKMKEIFGVNFVDASGDARNLVDVLDEVNQATANLGTADRSKKFNDAFGLLGITGASAIAKNAGSTKELLAQIQSASGIADKTAKEMDSGIGGAFRITLSAIEGVGNALAESLEPAIMFVAKAFQDGLGATTAWIEENKNIVALAVGGLVAFIALGAGLVTVGIAFSAFGVILGGLATAMGLLINIMTTIGGILAFIASPLGIAIALIGGLAAAFFYLTEVGQSVTQWFSDEFVKLQTVVVDTLGGMFNAIKGGRLDLAAMIAFTGVKLAIATIMEGVLSLFGSNIKSMAEMMKKFLDSTITFARGAMIALGAAVNVVTKGKFDSQIQAVTAASNAILTAVDVSGKAAADGFQLTFDKEALQSQLDALNAQAAESAAASNATSPEVNAFEQKLKDLLGGVNGNFNVPTAAATGENFGTFSGMEAVRAAFGSRQMDIQKRIAKATEETATNTKGYKKGYPQTVT